MVREGFNVSFSEINCQLFINLYIPQVVNYKIQL